MTTALERVAGDASEARVLICPRNVETLLFNFTQLEWNYILFYHFLYVKEHGGCCGN